MSIKLVLLKSNEEVIADVKELVDENDKPIFIVLENAYCCKLIESPVLLTAGAEETESKFSVQYYPWMPLSCLLYTSTSPRDISGSRMPSSA